MVENRDEAIAMGWLQQMRHFMYDEVFQEILESLPCWAIASWMPVSMMASVLESLNEHYSSLAAPKVALN